MVFKRVKKTIDWNLKNNSQLNDSVLEMIYKKLEKYIEKNTKKKNFST